MQTVLAIIFWASAGALVYAQFIYPLLVAAFAPRAVTAASSHRDEPEAISEPPHATEAPSVSLIVAAYAEAGVIAAKVANALALDYPRDKLQIIIACDGSPDDTARLAREAGADLVLELPRGGKMRSQNEAVAEARGELLAFSDANTMWEPDALRRLVTVLQDQSVGYVCGRVTFINEGGTNQEGVYWRYEMWLRERESRLRSVTAGNGAIYAVRASTYKRIAPRWGHDLTLPFSNVKLGRRALYEPSARASETMVPSIEGEFRRKRRMMAFTWPIVFGEGMLSPRGYGLTYSWMIFSHRVLRYSAPMLHLVALLSSLALAIGGSTLYAVLLAAQAALLLAALLARAVPLKPLLVARYYVLTTLSIGLGLWDHLRHGTPAGWTPPEGTR
ncbi:MAG: glycosyltransferase family 2 protein [Actinobacteria bacterium]|nr:glycosyltransferase family 2 protein [Actinomycetota bacterium]